MLNVSEENFCQFVRQVINTQEVLRHGGVNGVAPEVRLLFFNGRFYRYLVFDVLLRTVFNADEA